MNPHLYLYLAALLFAIGAAGVLLRRNAIMVFMCVELMLNAANLALVTAGRVHAGPQGQVLAFFTMVVAASEVVVGLAIIIAIFRARRSVSVDDSHLLGGDMLTSLIAALPLIPLAGAAALLLGGRRTNPVGPLLGTLVSAASFVVAAVAFVQLLGRGAADRSVGVVLYHWFSGGTLSVDVALRLDQLSVCFALLITGVGTLIHVYSIGYMGHDPDRRRFFGYLNLFLGAMLVLVLADNLVVLYLGWEGVGLASYLLIGFWQHKPSAAAAAKKAFVVNRVGDMGLALAVAVTVATFGTTRFGGFLPRAGEAGQGTVRSSDCCSCWRRAPSPPRCRCRAGWATRWRAPPRYPR